MHVEDDLFIDTTQGLEISMQNHIIQRFLADSRRYLGR